MLQALRYRARPFGPWDRASATAHREKWRIDRTHDRLTLPTISRLTRVSGPTIAFHVFTWKCQEKVKARATNDCRNEVLVVERSLSIDLRFYNLLFLGFLLCKRAAGTPQGVGREYREVIHPLFSAKLPASDSLPIEGRPGVRISSFNLGNTLSPRTNYHQLILTPSGLPERHETP
jgi:hypothetical protein